MTRIVHIVTSLRGGAGIAARRTHQALVEAGVDSYLAFLYGDSRNELGPLSKYSGTRIRRLHTLANKVASKRDVLLMTPFSGSLSHGWTEDFMIDESTVLHFHNTTGIVSPRQILQATKGSAVAVTLHDERFYTGGCHHAMSCGGLEDGCHACPGLRAPARVSASRNARLTLEAARRAILSRLAVLAPSRWIMDRMRQSPVGHLIAACHEPNLVDTEVFTPSRRESSRVRLGVEDAFVVATTGGKGKLSNTIVLDEIARRSYRLPVVNLHLGGGPAPTRMPQIVLPHTVDDRRIADFWAASDAFLNLTTADNFPNVNLECLASGVPAVVRNIGGSAEAIQATGGGLVINSELEATGALEEIVNNDSLREEMQTKAYTGCRLRYGHAPRCASLLAHYKSLLESA